MSEKPEQKTFSEIDEQIDRILTDKQKMFCNEYIVDFNRTQAAIRAGYAKDTARQQAYRLYSNIYIKNKITELLEERNAKLEISQEEIIAELKKVGFGDIGEAINEDGSIDISKIDTAIIQEYNKKITSGKDKMTIDEKIKLYSKIEGLKELNKMGGFVTEKKEVTAETKHIIKADDNTLEILSEYNRLQEKK